MSEEIKATEVKKEDTSYKLPDPVLPTMDMPERPKAGDPREPKFSCNGDNYQSPLLHDNSNIPDPKPNMPKIMIGIPILNYTREFVESFLKFWTEICLKAEGEMTVGYHFIYRRPVHMAEIQLAEIAVWNKCTHLLLMDDDIYDVKYEDLKKLVKADKDVIGGVMYASKFPFAMCVFRRYDTSKKVIDMPSDNSMFRLYEIPCRCSNCGMGLSHWDAKFCPLCGSTQDNMIQQADLIPFAFTLIKTSVFNKLKKPWFHCEIEYPSDSWFADRCIEAGIREYAHMGVRLNHNGINDHTRPAYFQMELERNRRESKGIVEVSPEEMDKHQFLLDKKMKEAENKLKPKLEVIHDQEVKNDSKTGDIKETVPKEQSA
jgi:hypothetical protein